MLRAEPTAQPPTAQPPTAQPPKMQGPTAQISAHFENAGGKTRMSACFASAPLKIAKTFALGDDLEGGTGVCVMDCSPGLLAGDHYELGWHLGENSRVLATTQGFTRVHPSRENPCRLNQKIRLERGARFELFPGPLMLFEGASLRSECEIEMAPDATFLGAEIIASGRVGHGEAFRFHAFQSRFRVRCDGKLIFCAQTALRPQNFIPKRAGAWDNFTHQGQFQVFARGVSEELQLRLRAVISEVPLVLGGVSGLEQGGIAVSLLGQRACDLESVMRQLREVSRVFLDESAL